jgi:hypothetical protein
MKTTFLNDARRRYLMEQLMGSLNLPASRAVEIAFLPNDVSTIEIMMSWHAWHVVKMAEQIAIIGESDPQRLFECSIFLSCDLITLEVFKSEAHEQGMQKSFTDWLKASASVVLQ